MARKNDIYSDEWCDLIFEGKNKEYGAYKNRKGSYARHFWALIVAAAIFVFASFAEDIVHKIVPQQKELEVSVRTLSNINIPKPKEQPLNVVPKIPPPPKIRNTIKFTPPVIKPDVEVNQEEEPKMQKEIVESKSAIGAVNFNKGTNDVNAPIATQNEKIAGEGEEEKPFLVAQVEPQFPGGETELMKFLQQNLKYPQKAVEAGVQGKVIVNFVVGKDGSISHIKVIRGIGFGCDEEAIRVLKKMPPWDPGLMGGKPVPVYYTFPINFQLK